MADTIDNIKIKFRKRTPIPLLGICIRYIAKNLYMYKNSGYLHLLPYEIKKLIIYQVTRVFNGFHDDELLKSILHCNIKDLVLSTSTITNNTLLNIVDVCPNIEQLLLSKGTYKFTRESLVTQLPLLKELRLLSISNTKLVDDKFIEIILKSCPNIYYLDIGNCSNITDKSMEFIKDLKIQKLNLLKTQITDNGLFMLKDSICSEYLEDLNVSFCKITSNGLSNLNWEKMKFIGFQECKIHDLAFIKSNKNLRFIQWTISN